MILLIFSIVGLALGPFLDRFAARKLSIVLLLEGFVTATILGLVLGHILPEAAEIAGWRCLPAAFVGLVGPQLLEKLTRGSEDRIHGTEATLAMAGLFFHTLLDGAALAGGQSAAASPALGVGVVLHRLPVGLTVWWLVRRSAGTLVAIISLFAICIGTIIGYGTGEATLAHLDNISIALFQAFVAGSLVHVVLHRSLMEAVSPEVAAGSGRVGPFDWSGIGAVLGFLVLLLVPLSGHAAEPRTGVAVNFLAYWSRSAPWLILGYLAVEIASRLIVESPGKWNLHTILLNWKPELSVPDGVSVSGLIVILVLAPVFYLPVLFLSISTLGWFLSVVLFSVTLAAAALLLLPMVGLQILPSYTPAWEHDHHDTEFARFAIETAVDRSAAWILIGLLVGSLLSVFVSSEWIETIPATIQIAALTVTGALVSLPAFASLPIAVAFLAKGGSPGAAISLIIAGAMLTSTTSRTLKAALGTKGNTRFLVVILAVSGLTGWLVNTWGWAPTLSESVDLSPLQYWCAILLGILFVLSLLRLGPARMVAGLDHGTHTHNH